MKNKLLIPLLILTAVWPLPLPVSAQTATKTVVIQNPESPDVPQAILISLRGKCECSENGEAFIELQKGHVFKQGDVVRTGEGARADLFFRRIGTTVRLQPNTEVKLVTLERHMKKDMPVMHTLVEIKKGRIFTVVRSYVPGSTFEIQNAAGRSVLEADTEKRYIVTADGSPVTVSGSVAPVKSAHKTGVTEINPGATLDAKEGKELAANPSETVETMIEFDELHSLVEQTDAAPKRK